MVSQLLSTLEARNGFPFNQQQRNAIQAGDGPLCIVAGPGTGKTEVLVVRCLKLLCCDMIPPGSIMMTTFTDKAATNLQDRLNDALLYLVSAFPQLANIDPSDLRIDTLHGLCNDILQEYRYTAYQNLRLLDEVESALLIHRRVSATVSQTQMHLQTQFQYLFGNKPQLSRWDWTIALRTLFDRLVDYRIQVTALTVGGGPWAELATAVALYEQELMNAYSCDFARLQRYFLDFLATQQGAVFLAGDTTGLVPKPPLTHVLVDEYQDTNPIQEEIYFRLCDAAPHNLTVVGDDDQALYRFRGGTVECMVGFGGLCQTRWGVPASTVYLSENYRSDAAIVTWCNNFIGSFPQMHAPDVRIPGKPALVASSGRVGTYPAVGLIREATVPLCAQSLATLVSELRTNNVISDYSQCVLLLRSTRTTPRYAGPFVQALNTAHIPVYNPRSKSFLEEDEVAEFLGALVSILDPNLSYVNSLMSPSIRQLVIRWISRFTTVSATSPQLQNYVALSAQTVQATQAGDIIHRAFPTILYRILAHEPFVGYQSNPSQDLRLSKLTRLMEAFSSQYGRALLSDTQNPGHVRGSWLGGFFYGLCGYMESQGMDDDEDEETVCPPGFFPIMTIHQSKGLEFDFVFVANMGQSVSLGSAHSLEADLRPFRSSQPLIVHNPQDSAWHDDIRLHYVAYSRAKYALIVVATNNQLRSTGQHTASFGGNGGPWVRQNVFRL
jgi:DNA helicase-2/ATP-dependent DNA helicase PcrA